MNLVPPFETAHYIQEAFADGYTNLTVRHYEAAAFDQISSRYRLLFLFPAGDRPWLVQHFTPEQL